MKRHLIALALSALFTLPALAADSNAATRRPMTLSQAIERVQSLFPGEVIAADYDASLREAGHYHVDLRLAPNGAVVRLEIDAADGSLLHVPRYADRLPDAPTVARIVERVGTVIPGRVGSVEFDDSNPRDPLFHVLVTDPNGFVYSLRVDPALENLAWRDTGPRAD
jgi:hypothetical protein